MFQVHDIKTSQVGHMEITWRLHKSQQKWSNLPVSYVTIQL